MLITESKCHLRVKHSVNSGMQAYSIKAKNNKTKSPSLLNHIMSKLTDTKADNNQKENMDKKAKRPYCKLCKTKGHATNDCSKWDDDPCTHCGWYNHESKDCKYKEKPKEQEKGKGKLNPCKC